MRVRTGPKAWWPSQELLTRSLEEQGAREVKEVEALQGPHGGAEAIKATPLFRLQRSGGVPHCFRYPSHPLPSHRTLLRQRLAPIVAGATLHRSDWLPLADLSLLVEQWVETNPVEADKQPAPLAAHPGPKPLTSSSSSSSGAIQVGVHVSESSSSKKPEPSQKPSKK